MNLTPLQKAQAAYDNRLPPDDPPEQKTPKRYDSKRLSVRHIKRARKSHSCDNCGAGIPKGWPYTRWVGLVGWAFTNYNCCYKCAETLGLLR